MDGSDQQSSQIVRLNNKIRDLESEILSLRRGSSEEADSKEVEIVKLRNKVQELEIKLESSRKEIENVQKSYLGKTTYTSDIKRSAYQKEFQSPESGYGRYQSPQTES